MAHAIISPAMANLAMLLEDRQDVLMKCHVRFTGRRGCCRPDPQDSDQ